MRSGITRMGLVVGVVLLAACQGEAAERQELVDAGVKSCVDGFQDSGAAAGTGADPRRICDCAVGKMTEGKSIEEIRQFSRQETPTQTDVQTIYACIADEMQRSGKAGADAKGS